MPLSANSAHVTSFFLFYFCFNYSSSNRRTVFKYTRWRILSIADLLINDNQCPSRLDFNDRLRRDRSLSRSRIRGSRVIYQLLASLLRVSGFFLATSQKIRQFAVMHQRLNEDSVMFEDWITWYTENKRDYIVRELHYMYINKQFAIIHGPNTTLFAS